MRVFGLCLLLPLAFGASVASAAPVTVTSIDAVWSAASTTSASASGIDTGRISWGNARNTENRQSSYSFDTISAPFVLETGGSETLGAFTHDNWTIARGFTLLDATLELFIGLDIEGVASSLAATYFVTHDETLNSAGACPDGSVGVCDDVVTFTQITTSSAPVTIGNTSYSFLLDGFADAGGTMLSQMMSAESASNTAYLMGSVEATPVPLPATLPLLAAAFGAVALLRRRRASI